MENKIWMFLFILASAVLVLGAFYILGSEEICEVEEINNSYNELKQILYFEQLEADISDDVGEIYDYVDLAYQAYDYDEYSNVVFYCEKSRDISREYEVKLNEIRAEYPEERNEMQNIRYDMLRKEQDYMFALYQACEYFESAARNYQVGDYDNGGVNIDMMGDQIELHDAYIDDWTLMDAKYRKLRKELLV